MKLVKQNAYLLWYGISLAALIFLLKWLQWKFLIVDNATEIYVGLIAVFFTALGVWIASQLVKPKVEQVVIEPSINQAELDQLQLSAREYEVLVLLTLGHSNAEIANRLFLSVSTVKTHVSNVLLKLQVKSRTQAIEKAKRLRLVQ